MSSSSASIRYHSLDALRATAMLMGILLHTAWIMGPTYMMTPISDVSGNYFCHFFFHLVHMFRMQVFFLVAGFFARMVLQKRGTWGFIRHRLARIGIPLLVGWLILFPWMSLYYTWGGLLSGRVLSDAGFWTTAWHELVGLVVGFLPLMHLWFLYFLLLIYALTVVGRAVLQYALDRKGRQRERFDRFLGRVIRSPWNVVWLAIPSAALLWLSRGWHGIEGDAWMLIPSIMGLLGYWVFFIVGWFMYGQVSLLDECTKRWRLHLALGLLASIPLVGLMRRYVDTGIVTPIYPFMLASDVKDYPRMRAELLNARGDSSETPRRAVWDALSPLYQEFIAERPELSEDQTAGLSFELMRAVIMNPDFYRPDEWGQFELSPEITAFAERPADEQSLFHDMILRRKLLEAAFPGAIAPNVTAQPFYRRLKVAYACGYAIAMWLLVFGTMGFFMHFFSNPSGLLRYLADSSYWLYLLHLPVLFQIEVLIARIEMNWVLKFLIYNLVALAVLIPSYHYFVRSTLIGKVLNGRAYPLAPWFRTRTADGPAVSKLDVPAQASEVGEH